MIMTKYRVQIDGRNFLIDIDGVVTKRGFITFRYVKAEDPTQAEERAVQMIREEKKLRDTILNEKTDPPIMHVLEILELDPESHEEIQPGFIFYEMNPKKWWQFWRKT